MISREVRVWLLAMAVMSATGWVATLSSLFVLIAAGGLAGAMVLPLGMLAVASTLATFHLMVGWRRAQAARKAFELGQRHARILASLR
ncbi:hypothetical protein ABZ470_26560 [Streptosporangium sp. NPDC020072]|uniref:hypothetical protein n=1 Tax=Streptosporangium sp. NPDC020072 TaxID=3154788 RepID=UPI00342ABCF6